MNVGQTKITAGVAVCQPLMIYPHDMQNYRVVVVHVARIGDDSDSIVVRGAINHTAFDSGAGQEAREGTSVMIAAFVVWGSAPRGAAKFRTPSDQSFLEKTALF